MHRSYRLARRSFLAGIGGAFGLKIMLRDFEAMAAGATSPPRFLAIHWPVGTIKYAFLPNGGVKPNGVGALTDFSPILMPFKNKGLDTDMSLIWGLHDLGPTNGAGGHEGGTPMSTTGTGCPGTRLNGGESDDGVAGGPSWDQIILNDVQDDPTTGAVSMKRPGIGYANAICDQRIDSQETSTRCLSYSHQTADIPSANNPGQNVTEHVPLLPELAPAQLYMKLFTGFMPGGSTPENMAAAKLALQQRKSVLDFCLRELNQLKSVAPAAEGKKIDIHADACRKIELQVSDLLNGKIMTPNGCVVPAAPDPNLVGQAGSSNPYNTNDVPVADDQIHEQIGKLHAGILLAAMQCDIISTATFQWSPGTNHVSFKGLRPDEPTKIFMHHPQSHKIGGDRSTFFDAPPAGDALLQALTQFMINVHTWYNDKTGDIIKMFKDAQDAFGGNMLDNTVIPMFTEVAMATHQRDPKAALIFGGKNLGIQHGKYVNFEDNNGAGTRAHVDFWATVAQAYFRSTDPASYLGALQFASPPKPIDGFWTKPA